MPPSESSSEPSMIAPAAPRKRTRRDDFVQVAQLIAERDGFAGVTLTNVAATAGVTTPALYTHFTNRVDLLEEILESTAREYLIDIRDTDDPAASTEVRLRVRLRRWASTSSARLKTLHDAILHIPDSDRIKQAVDLAQAEWIRFVDDVLTTGIARAEVRPDLDVVAARELLTSTLLGIEISTQSGVVDGSMDRQTDQLMDMFLTYIRPVNH